MQTQPVTVEQLGQSVIAVPPLARQNDLQISANENRKIVRHIESGGVKTLLYGGNANLYHIRLDEYEFLLQMLTEIAGEQTLVIPSAGPAYGTMQYQADILRDFPFPTVMILPQNEIATSAGVAAGTRQFSERIGRPVVLYVKHDRVLDVDDIRRLVDDGIVSFIKYAVVRTDPLQDDYLKSITDVVPASRIVSGIGEQPAIIHMRDFELAGFTSGCVCIAPRLSMEMLDAIRTQDFETADRIRLQFSQLEDHRNAINPIRVLHAAVELAGIADTGPLLPLLSPIEDDEVTRVAHAARELLARDSTLPT